MRLGGVCVVKCSDLLSNRSIAVPVVQKQGHNSEQTYGREKMKLNQQQTSGGDQSMDNERGG